MAKATKIEAVVETKRVVRQPERVLLELTPLEAHALAQLLANVGGFGALRDAGNAVLRALETAGIAYQHLSYRNGYYDEDPRYWPCVSTNEWRDTNELPDWCVDRIAALVRRSEGLE